MDGAMEGLQPKKKENAADRTGERRAVEGHAVPRQAEPRQAVPRQIAPGMQPVYLETARNVVVVGSTHLVEMRGHTLLNGRGNYWDNQRYFLRQGTKVVIDEQRVIKSRRGPNQGFFRDEDKKRGTHIYRWVHVLSVGGKDVSQENLYIREGTYRDEAWLAGRTLSPPSGGIRPSIAVAPGTRQMPLLRPAMEGEYGRDILTPEQRSLNRLARGEWVTLSPQNKTPHLAMMVWHGKIYVAGNTDKVIIKREIYRSVLEELHRMLSMPKEDRLNEIGKEMKKEADSDEVKTRYEETQAKRQKIHSKLSKIAGRTYHNKEYQNNEIMNAIMNALANPAQYIVICQEKIQFKQGEQLEQKGKQQKQRGKRPPIHGEMLILDMLYDEYKDMEERDRQIKRRRMKKVFAGGNLQDCIFCHWAFDIFNMVIGSKLGVMVVSSGTHGQIPGRWRIPRWMISEREAMDMLQERIEKLNRQQENDNLYRIEGEVLVYGKNSQMRNTMLDESDSEG